ncbi:P-loop containing nucleoside triphosphate hydrolase protein [Cantharellus anzutake]|uniref:P-loop containing nucleoside triphosphate hydrolase protein n=1 Tax=Cantharellus anzutake TaxID=1750568 RepID=UPI0019050059|nr:P-loop containing nucleoside triphosphate hydrolase protein [Cantharellus anzutake]KAF8331886.1 P-loop containing nucleoside triphosphate hydrolase protein [Cantharellus anzutake]
MPISHPEVYVHTGVQPPRGVLLHGPPGCGKTMLANAIAGELEVPFISISAPSIVSGMSGESERSLRGAFDEAQKAAPSILFIDEIDAITPKRESAQREMERRIVAQFLTCMDELSWEKTGNKPVIVIGATNRPDSLDSALRRAGRFDHEISMTVPDEIGREQILRAQCVKLKLTGGFDFRALAKATPGYVGADLSALTGAAGVIAVKRIFRSFGGFDADPPSVNGKDQPGVHTQSPEDIAQASDMQVDEDITSVISSQAGVVAPSTNPISSSISSFLKRHPNPLTPEELEPLTITYDDFLAALTQVQPSSKREGFTTIPDVTWADIGALHSIRDELKMAIVQPIRRPEVFRAVGITASCGVLLWGPPGCGKTLLAKAVANESRANFISVKGPELLNKYVGESERAVRQVFSRAAASAPCVIFFDELDALVPRRDDSLSESSARVVNTLLTELDGLQVRKEVYVIAATNRPDMIDPAMCRPGRLDKLLYVDLPDGDERTDILRTLLRNVPLAPDDSSSLSISASLDAILNIVRQKCDGYSGADLAALVREAGVLALRETLNVLDAAEASGTNVGPSENQLIKVTVDHFERATGKVLPSVSVAQRRKYEALRSKFAGLPMRSRVEREEIPRGSRDDPAL